MRVRLLDIQVPSSRFEPRWGSKVQIWWVESTRQDIHKEVIHNIISGVLLRRQSVSFYVHIKVIPSYKLLMQLLYGRHCDKDLC